MPNGAKSKIDRLLIDSALEPDLLRRLIESPDEVFPDFDLTEEEKDILRRPDSRLLRLLGAALTRQAEPVQTAPAVAAPQPESVATAPATTVERTLPDTLVALTVVPCALQQNGQFQGISYAAWVNPMAEGTDPSTLPPAGAVLPGLAMTPLYAVIQLSAVLSQDEAGKPRVGLWASFRQSTNVQAPAPPETAGDPELAPFGDRADSPEVRSAAAAVRAAAPSERYGKLMELLRVLRHGDVR